MKKKFIIILLLSNHLIFGQGKWERKFEQLGTQLPTPNNYRSASGAPGKDYWQQKADYDIQVEINPGTREVYAKSFVTYTNNSPDNLNYIWIHLEQNIFREDSIGNAIADAVADNAPDAVATAGGD